MELALLRSVYLLRLSDFAAHGLRTAARRSWERRDYPAYIAQDGQRERLY